MKRITAALATAMLSAGLIATASPARADTTRPATPANCRAAWGTGFWFEQHCPLSRPQDRPRYVKVVRGDTLWRIAVNAYSYGENPNEHAGQQYRKIMRLNHLRSTTIRVGQRLRVR